MDTTCSSSTCSQTGTLYCNGCKSTTYCSKTCQIAHWPIHKQNCAATQKHNCYLVRAAPSNGTSSFNSISDQIEPLNLEHYGNEFAEIKELKTRLGWTSASEVGKFYDHLGTDTWYYYVYGQRKGAAEGKPKNEIASRACGKEIYGDVAVIRSGPGGEDTPELFASWVLRKALEYYDGRNSGKVFAERESSRIGRKMGVDLSGATTMNL